jgi:hypothetical protein
MEEYILNWKKWVSDISGIIIGWDDFIITNAAVIITGICVSMIGFKNPYISLIFPALMFINGLFFHILPTLIKRKFSPGVITSIIFFIPLSFLTYYEAFKLNILDITLFIISFIGGCLVMFFPVFLQLIKKKYISR